MAEEILKNEALTVNDAIQVVQLPQIRERLQEISDEFEARFSQALAMEHSDESVKRVKAFRAELNRAYDALESMRKNVKAAVMQPYESIEAIYKSLISDKYSAYVTALNNLINTTEGELKKQKESELAGYFLEYKASKGPHLDFLTLQQTGVKINLSCSLKSLKDAVRKVIDQVNDDLAVIELYENGAELMIEYKKTLNLAQSIASVDQRQKQIAEQKARAEQLRMEREAREKERQEREQAFADVPVSVVTVIEPLPEPVIQPTAEIIQLPVAKPEDDQTKYKMIFVVTAIDTKARLKEFKEMALERGYTVGKLDSAKA